MATVQNTRVFCFGNTAHGELGLGGIEDENILTPRQQKLLPSLLNSAKDIPYMNGIYSESQIHRKKPKSLFSNFKVIQIASGRNHSLLLLKDEESDRSLVLSCGSNERNQLGRTGSWRRLEVIKSLCNHVIVSVACGSNHSLALSDAGQIFAFGCNIFGQCGVGKTEEDSVERPSLIKKLAAEMVVQVACGGNHSLCLTKTGLVYSWGSNAYGQLGIGTRGNCMLVPEKIVSLSAVPIRQISAGGSHSIALSCTGTLYVWGKNEFGQLGLSDETQRLIPTPQKTLRRLRISYVACGEEFTAALTSEGGLFTWGFGMFGQLGHGRCLNETVPKRVIELMGNAVIQVSCGRCHTLAAIGGKNRVYAFGLNGCGQLGIGTTSNKNLPIAVNGSWVEGSVKDLVIRQESGPVVRFSRPSPIDSPIVGSPTKTDSLQEPASNSDLSASKAGSEETLASSPMLIDIVDDDTSEEGEEKMETEPPMIEEPEEHRSSVPDIDSWEPKFVCSQNVIVESSGDNEQEGLKIDEYNSDSDLEDDDATSKRSHFSLYEIIASKGDQSFIITSRLEKGISPRDFRKEKPEQLSTINNDMLRKLVAVQPDQQIPDEVMDYIEYTFGSVAVWNASYVNTYDLDRDLCEPYIDYEAAAHGFNLLEEVKNNRIIEIITELIVKQLIPNMPTAGNSQLDAEIFRVYILLPLYHVFHTGLDGTPQSIRQNITNLIVAYARKFLQLTEDQQKVIMNWWAQMDLRFYRDMVRCYKRAVTATLDEQLRLIEAREKSNNNSGLDKMPTQTLIDEEIHSNLRFCLGLLARLHYVNHRYKRVSYKEFYIEDISSKADVKMDYVYWLASRQGIGNRARSISHNLFFCDYPFIFDGPAKTQILQTDSQIQQNNAAENALYQSLVLAPGQRAGSINLVSTESPFFELKVSRNNLLQETINQLSQVNKINLKKPLKIIFDGEEAVDAGAGMKKEFFLLLVREVLDPKYGIFNEYSDSHSIWFNPGETETLMYEVLGTVSALAIYNSVIIYLPFPLALYKKLLNEELGLDDFGGLEPVVARNLKEMLDTEFTPEEFDAIYGEINFTITLKCFSSPVEYELCKGGRDKKLTYDNRQEYVKLYWRYVLVDSVEKQFDAFKRGFVKVLDSGILNLFHAEELQTLVAGQDAYDWKGLEEGAQYKPPFNSLHPTIIKFWNVFHSLDEQSKKKFLLFLTGSDRIPITGMKSLKIGFQPMKVSQEFLPVAHTCFNVLDLPEDYETEEKLKEKLLAAIENTEGFALA